MNSNSLYFSFALIKVVVTLVMPIRFFKLPTTVMHCFTYVLAIVLMEGTPSNTMTRSAKYVAMMKSCSTTKAVFLACKMNLKGVS